MKSEDWKLYNEGKYEHILQKLKRLNAQVKAFGLQKEVLFYTRHTQFNGEPCDLCGATKLIYPVGRYIIFNQDKGSTKDDVFLCGNCINIFETHTVLPYNLVEYD